MINLSIRTSALSVLLVFAGSNAVRADEPQSSAVVTPLISRDLTGIPGKEAVMMTVEYLPGGASRPHRHDAHVFVYVLEGALLMQVDGQAAETLTPGQTFYENPQDVHRVSANASATEPVRFLVFIVKDKSSAVTRPVAQENGK